MLPSGQKHRGLCEIECVNVCFICDVTALLVPDRPCTSIREHEGF